MKRTAKVETRGALLQATLAYLEKGGTIKVCPTRKRKVGEVWMKKTARHSRTFRRG